MKLHYFSSLLALFFTSWISLYGQTDPPNEIGMLIGTTNYAGDIVKKGNFDWGAASLAYGAFFRAYTGSHISWRFSLLHGKVKGNDLDWVGTDRVDRGFNFSSPLTEFSGRAEYDIFSHESWNFKSYRKSFSLFLYAGVGVSLIKPKTYFNPNLGATYDSWIAKDLQNKETKLFTVPIGFGVKYDLDNERKWTIGAEFGINPIWSDYLDGISVSANPNNDDWYAVGNLAISYRLR